MITETQRIVSLFLAINSSSGNKVLPAFKHTAYAPLCYSIQTACPELALCLPGKEDDH
jgi:hypothetical protein